MTKTKRKRTKPTNGAAPTVARVKTSLALPPDLIRRARIVAASHGIDVQDMMTHGLEAVVGRLERRRPA
jgi:hypothetical protein